MDILLVEIKNKNGGVHTKEKMKKKTMAHIPYIPFCFPFLSVTRKKRAAATWRLCPWPCCPASGLFDQMPRRRWNTLCSADAALATKLVALLGGLSSPVSAVDKAPDPSSAPLISIGRLADIDAATPNVIYHELLFKMYDTVNFLHISISIYTTLSTVVHSAQIKSLDGDGDGDEEDLSRRRSGAANSEDRLHRP